MRLSLTLSWDVELRVGERYTQAPGLNQHEKTQKTESFVSASCDRTGWCGIHSSPQSVDGLHSRK